ncbi:FitA-like ribbon-helix-helix domain-containing protein [Sphingomonas sp. CV7422]|uniref:FitA-like ribbon-helix-helix domain-containing protein n=1 Tax=Sphingomonas sp. CV7422 TaxID=3018036 RepID=UPI0022FF0C17|nr:hypothetical protein [Sphingomonas sp. CV7422]
MGQVLIRDLDDALLQDYQEAADGNGRSLEAELRDALRRLRPVNDHDRRDLQARLAAIRAMTPNAAQTPAEVLVREDREGFRSA